MEWAAIAVLGLAVWAWRQSRRIEALTLELAALKARVVAMSAPPLLLDMPLRAGEDAPLLLETPAPAPSNDSEHSAVNAPPASPQTPSAPRDTTAPTQWLAAMAVLAALAAPLAGAALRPPPATTLFICIIAAACFALAASKRWTWVAMATLAGLFAWFVAAIGAVDISRALAVASLAALGAVSLAMPRGGDAVGDETWARVRADAPSAVISASSVLLIWCWLAIAELHHADVARVAWVGAMLIALAAAAVRGRIAAPASFGVAVISLVAGFVFFIGIRFQFPPLGNDFYAAVLACAALIALAALYANPHRRARLLVAIVGSVGAAVLVALAATTRDDWYSVAAWGALFAGGAALLACASRQEANALTPWVGAGAALLMLGAESAFPEPWRCAAYAGVAAALAVVFALRGWRSAGVAALIAGVIAIVYSLAALAASPTSEAFATSALAAALLFAASRIADEAEFRSPPSLGLAVASASAALLALLLAMRATGVSGTAQFASLILALAGVTVLAWLRRARIASPSTGPS